MAFQAGGQITFSCKQSRAHASQQARKYAVLQEAKVSVALLAGNTGAGVYHEWPQQQVVISVLGIPALHNITYSQVTIRTASAAHLISA